MDPRLIKNVTFPPESDSQALRREQREPLLAAAGAARSPLRRHSGKSLEAGVLG